MTVRVCGAILLLALAVAGSASAQDVPKGTAEFTDFVAAQLRRQVKGAPVEVKGPLTLGIGGLQANLDRIHVYCRDNAMGCRREVSNYVKGIDEILKAQHAPL